MASVQSNSWEPRTPLPTSERAPENRAWPSTDDSELLETHEELLVRAVADSVTEALQRDLTASVLELQAATAQAHETIQGLQQQISSFHTKATARVVEHQVQMQAVAESARQHARREMAIMQERIEQLQTALSASHSEAEQARSVTEQARSDAVQARREAELARSEAERARSDAVQARREAVQARSEAEQARSEAAMQLKTVQLMRVKPNGDLEWGTTEEDSEDVEMLRARCEVLRCMLECTRPRQMAAKSNAFKAAAQGRPSGKRVEARSAADTGQVKNAVAESVHQRAQREMVVLQERIDQMRTAYSTSRIEAEQQARRVVEQARDEGKQLGAQMVATQQPLEVAETEAHELRRQLGEKRMLANKAAREMHRDHFNSDAGLAMRAEIEIEKETLRLVRAGNIKAAMQLQAKKEIVQLWRGKADGAAESVGSRPIGAPVGSLADELVDIFIQYRIPAMPKYEFSNLC
ncbi:hypothetical protein Vafri_3061 [Volvox africanus]|uniref:Uncharacterized protein n=1 Tax=Volvox africanus TaxID=51714 RepID=A0A8J4AQZ6_9CHLO|nr:hypothetical protein Vafri_3061 [Volvox africanus]